MNTSVVERGTGAAGRAVFDHEHEKELFHRLRRGGDARAADEIVRASLPLVIRIARKYSRYGLRQPDLVAEGNFGLVRALAKFDPQRGVSFGTYARYWVHSYVIDYVIGSWSLVRSSGVLRSRHFFKLRRERARLYALLGNDEEVMRALAERVGIKASRLGAMLHRLDTRNVSLDLPANDEQRPLAERLQAPGDPERIVADREFLERFRQPLAAAVATLSARERYIVDRRLLADAQEELSLAELGRELGVSRERVRQLQELIIEKLRSRIFQDRGV